MIHHQPSNTNPLQFPAPHVSIKKKIRLLHLQGMSGSPRAVVMLDFQVRHNLPMGLPGHVRRDDEIRVLG